MRAMNDFFKQWKEEACLNNPVLYDINWDEGTITIYTTKPGYLIGEHGILVTRYTDVMRKIWPSFKSFKFKEVYHYVD